MDDEDDRAKPESRVEACSPMSKVCRCESWAYCHVSASQGSGGGLERVRIRSMGAEKENQPSTNIANGVSDRSRNRNRSWVFLRPTSKPKCRDNLVGSKTLHKSSCDSRVCETCQKAYEHGKWAVHPRTRTLLRRRSTRQRRSNISKQQSDQMLARLTLSARWLDGSIPGVAGIEETRADGNKS